MYLYTNCIHIIFGDKTMKFSNEYDDIIYISVGIIIIGFVGTEGLKALANVTGLTGTTATLVTNVLPAIGVIIFLFTLIANIDSRKKH